MLVEPARSGQVAVSGLLSGAGMDMLRVVVRTGPVPAQPPADLTGWVGPVHDHDGALGDWRFLSASGGEAGQHDHLARYRDWRSGFATDHFIGERALVHAFLGWAAGRCEVSALTPLWRSAGHVSAAAVLQMRWQTERVRAHTVASDAVGLGVFIPPDSRNAARGLVPTQPPTQLLAAAGAELAAGPSGLLLRAGPAVPGAAPMAVQGWRATGRGVAVLTSGGEVLLTESPATDLLRMLGRHAPAVAVRRVRLHVLVAPLLTFLHDATELAVHCHSGLDIRSGWA